MKDTVGTLLATADARRFIGRERELRAIERLLDDDSSTAVVFVHGPGGIGKSTLVREAARRGALAGFDVFAIDGREASSDPGAVTRAFDAVAGSSRPLVTIDSYELISAIGASLRDAILPALPATARVLIAGRRLPEPGWSADGWESLTLPVPLAPLADAEARILLRTHGIEDERRTTALLRWARGVPLALAMGADAMLVSGTIELRALDDHRALAGALLERLAGDELGGADREVLAVSAIAPAVDARLLAAVLPGLDADYAETWLRGLSFAATAGPRVRIHEQVAAALRTELRALDPDRERDLRRRVGDHLHQRAATGQPGLVGELLSLIDDPAVRRGFALGTGDRYRIDRVRAADVDAAATALGADGTSWWPGIRTFFERAPDRVLVVRDASGALAGFAITVTPATAPSWIDEDVVLGPWLAHARGRAPDGNVLLWRNTFDLTDDPGAPVVGLLNTAGIQLSGLPNVRMVYGHADPADAEAQALSRAIGAVVVPELEIRDGDRVTECHVVDHGPGGILAATTALLYRDLGLPPAAIRTAEEVAADTVRGALRSFHDPLALAASPLAQGATVEARAASVRALLREAAAASFGYSEDERLMRAALERGYLDGEGGHARAMLALNVSRTTYFRRLADASDRVTTYILAARG